MTSKLKEITWKYFSLFVKWGMANIPFITVWVAEKCFFIAPGILRSWVKRYTNEEILACVLGGTIPMIGLEDGDAILFYPLPDCVRYELKGFPELKPKEIFDGHILAFLVPNDKRRDTYDVVGYDKNGKEYALKGLHSHSKESGTKITKGGVHIDNANKIWWKIKTKKYLTSFIMIHTSGKPHAAGYSQRPYWKNYPETTYLPHVVIPPDATPLGEKGVSIILMIVENDAWVPEILVR